MKRWSNVNEVIFNCSPFAFPSVLVLFCWLDWCIWCMISKCFQWGWQNKLAHMQYFTCPQVYLVVSVQIQCPKKITNDLEKRYGVNFCYILNNTVSQRKDQIHFFSFREIALSVSLSYWLPRTRVDYLNLIACWYTGIYKCKYQWKYLTFIQHCT